MYAIVHLDQSPFSHLRKLNQRTDFNEKDPKDIFMRPRLVQERFLLEKLRAHADELVNPPMQAGAKKETVSSPILQTRETNNNDSGLIPVQEEAEVILKSEPPSPEHMRKETDSFLKEVVEGAKGLNIDLEGSQGLNIEKDPIPVFSPLTVKKPEVTVARSHTVAVGVKSTLIIFI